MTESTGSRRQSAPPEEPGVWAQGLILFAAVMMFVGGGFQAIAGLAAIFENEFYTVTPNYVLEFDVTAWGWIHLLLGVIVIFAGYGLLSGQTWARVVGIVLASVSALVNFAFIPYYPFWSLSIIALDVFIIWALATQARAFRM
ncbi:MAG TPA: hypothetical protein VLA55_01635 [Ornithinibacter sp.]|nr:hypothetical protein [Ornithinibacter sp.]